MTARTNDNSVHFHVLVWHRHEGWHGRRGRHTFGWHGHVWFHHDHNEKDGA